MQKGTVYVEVYEFWIYVYKSFDHLIIKYVYLN